MLVLVPIALLPSFVVDRLAACPLHSLLWTMDEVVDRRCVVVFSFRWWPLCGCQDERAAIIRDGLKPGVPEEERDWDVLLTTYEVANIEKTALNKIGWRYLIIDEAHRWVVRLLLS